MAADHRGGGGAGGSGSGARSGLRGGHRGRIANPDPRVTSAIYSAFEVETKAKAASPDDFELWADWEGYFGQKCSLIAVLYSDAEVEVVHSNFDRATSGGTAFDSVAAGYAAAADEQPAGPGKAQVQCVVA